MRATLAIVLVTLISPAAAAQRVATVAEGDTAAAQSIAQQMVCTERPNPTPVLRYFVKRGLIRVKEMVGQDSISCWKLKRAFDLNGLPITGICAYEDDPLVLALDPDFYWRGPGTSPGVRLDVVTDAPRPAIEAWAAKAYVDPKQIETTDILNGTALISCSEWSVKKVP